MPRHDGPYPLSPARPPRGLTEAWRGLGAGTRALLLGLVACGADAGPGDAGPRAPVPRPPEAPQGIASDPAGASDDPDAGGLPATFAGEAVCAPPAGRAGAGPTAAPPPNPPPACLPRRYVLTLRADGFFALRVQELAAPAAFYGDTVGRWRQDAPDRLRLQAPPPLGSVVAVYSPATTEQPARLWLPLGPGHALAVLWRAERALAFEAETLVSARVLPGAAGVGAGFLLRDCHSGLVMVPRAGGLPGTTLPALAASGRSLRLAGRVGSHLGDPGGGDAAATAFLAIDHVFGAAEDCATPDPATRAR